MRHAHSYPTRTNRKCSSAVGRLYSIAGGAPNRPTVALAGDAGWFRDGDAWYLSPQSIAFQRGYSRAGDVTDILEWLRDDLSAWQSMNAARKNLPVLVAVETSQSPHLFRVLSTELREDISTLAVGFRLRAGDQSAREGVPAYLEGAGDVGGNWLASWFDATASREPPSEQLHSRPYAPGRVALTFDQFTSEDAPGLELSKLRSSLSAAETLRVKAQRDSDISMALNADESLAAALMLGVLAIDQRTPPLETAGASGQPWGWAPISRGLHCVF